MDEDEVTKQRALDAAAAVAVAAAAAAQQSRNAATASVNDIEGHIQTDDDHAHASDNVDEQHIDDGLDSLRTLARHINDSNGVLQSQDRDENGLIRKFDDSTGDYSESFVAASEQQDQEGESSTLDSKPKKAKKPSVQHTKRRKINTCLPCKRRKVKCDREKPYCGQCRKHDFPMSDCTWSVFSVDQLPTTKMIDASSFPVASSSSANGSNVLSDNAIADSAAATAVQWLDMSNAPWANFTSSEAEQTIQTLQNKISSLEATIEELRNGKTADGTAAKDEQMQVGE